MTIIRNLDRFPYFDFATIFLDNENTFFKKLEYRFSVKSTVNKSASFPYKYAISEANVKKNRMGSTKWTYHKKQSFAINYFVL